MNPELEEVSQEELEQLALSTPRATAADDDGTGIEVCPCCLEEVGYCDNLCPHCGGPVSAIAGLLPWENTLATGYVYRKAVASPGKPVVVIGMWMQYCPGLIWATLLMSRALTGGHLPFGSYVDILCFGVTNTAVLYQTTRNYFRQKR